MKEETELIERCINAYIKNEERKNNAPAMPNRTDSYMDEYNMIHLINVNGELATYRYRPKTDTIQKVKLK
jgi:hypothetical protein